MNEDRETTEVRDTNEQVGDTNVRRQTVAKKTSVSSVVVAQRIVYYIGGFIIALLFLRLILLLLGANQGNAFVDFIYGLTSIFVMPFVGIFGELKYGVSLFEPHTVVAIIVYALVTVGIAKLFTLGRPRDEI